MGFRCSYVVDVEELHRTVDKMHRTEENIIHSVNHQMPYVKVLDSAIKFNTEAVKTI
jgi:hypothetical protein